MAASSKTASAPSETKLVQELVDILDKSGLAELEYETDAVAIRLSRVTGTAPVVAAAPAVSAHAAAAPAPAPPPSGGAVAIDPPAARTVRYSSGLACHPKEWLAQQQASGMPVGRRT